MNITEFLAKAENNVLEELKKSKNEEDLISKARTQGFDFTYTESKRLFRLLTSQINEDDIINIVGGYQGSTANGYCKLNKSDILMLGVPSCDSYKAKLEPYTNAKSCINCIYFS